MMVEAVKDRPKVMVKVINLIAFVLIFGFNLRFFVQVLLDHDVVSLSLILYVILLLSIDYSRNLKYLPYLIIMSMIIAVNTDAARLGFIILLCFFYLRMDIKTLARNNLIVGVILLLAVWYCVEAGILEYERNEYITELGTKRVRQTLGMGYNSFSLYVSSLVANLYVLIAHKNKYLVMAVVFGISYITYKMTGSQTSFVGGMLLTLIIFAYRSRLKKFIMNKTLLLVLPLLLTFATLFMARHREMFSFLDILLTGRLRNSEILLNYVTFKNLIVGTPGIDVNSGAIVDNIYLRLIYEGGIVFYIFFYMLYYKTVKSLSAENEYLMPIVIYSLIIGFMETNFLSVAIIGNSLIWAIIYQGAHKYDAFKFKSKMI